MPDTLPNVNIPANVWIDLYAATGVPVGEPISIQNIGTTDIYLTVRATQPPIGYDAYNVVQRLNGIRVRNTRGDSGAWAFSPNTLGKLNVRRV